MKTSPKPYSVDDAEHLAGALTSISRRGKLLRADKTTLVNAALVLTRLAQLNVDLEAARSEATNLRLARVNIAADLVKTTMEVERLHAAAQQRRTRLPDTRPSVTRKFTILRGEDPLRIYVTVGLYEDGSPGEVFIKCDRQGSLTSGAFDAVALVISIALQHGVPLAALTNKLRGMSFEPNGMTGDKDFPIAKSVLDLIARWLETRFTPPVKVIE